MSDQEYEKDQFLPYWTEYWPSSTALLRLLQNHPLAPGNKIAEAGCGLGVLSAYLTFCGCDVVPFDLSFSACLYAQANISQFKPTAKAVCTDWRALPFRPNSFDCIIAADVLYESRWIHPVLSFCDRYLKTKAFALIADPCRKHWSLFKDNAVEYGFRVEVVEKSRLNENKTVIEVLKLDKLVGKLS